MTSKYEDTIAPAVRAADLEPYRVDKDDDVVIPVGTLHEQIGAVTLCLADITIQNPKVMYELGYAIASGKDVIIGLPLYRGDSCESTVRYEIALSKVEQHARFGTARGPKDILRKQKLRKLLGVDEEVQP